MSILSQRINRFVHMIFTGNRAASESLPGCAAIHRKQSKPNRFEYETEMLAQTHLAAPNQSSIRSGSTSCEKSAPSRSDWCFCRWEFVFVSDASAAPARLIGIHAFRLADRDKRKVLASLRTRMHSFPERNHSSISGFQSLPSDSS